MLHCGNYRLNPSASTVYIYTASLASLQKVEEASHCMVAQAAQLVIHPKAEGACFVAGPGCCPLELVLDGPPITAATHPPWVICTNP
jgi:hypothetical protein